jgi:hypothetical protein
MCCPVFAIPLGFIVLLCLVVAIKTKYLHFHQR